MLLTEEILGVNITASQGRLGVVLTVMMTHSTIVLEYSGGILMKLKDPAWNFTKILKDFIYVCCTQ
jgi:hypothetical protein